MAKKNTKLIKKALNALKGGRVRLCADNLKNGSSYCAVGFLTVFALKHEGKKVEKAVKNLEPFIETMWDENNNPTGNIERSWTVRELFARDNTEAAIAVCEKVYGVDNNILNNIVSLNDAELKTSRVERLRLGLKSLLSDKKAKKATQALWDATRAGDYD